MINETVVELSRFHFGFTVLYHFIFVPITLGISWVIFCMELIYVRTGKVIYRDMAKFWGKLFGINFAIGVATGVTMEFEFGTNWSYYSHYVGDIFGTPLAIEALLAFFMESTFIGLMFMGWNRMGKIPHLIVTGATALGSNLSAMWILIANGWMQFPSGSQFNPERMRMEMSSLWEVVLSPVAQAKFTHMISGGYVTGSCFVIGVSAFFMIQGKHLELAKRSMTVGITFCIMALIGSAVTGDMSAIHVTNYQPAKLAAMEAEYETQPAPASWSIFAIPNEEAMENDISIKIPWLLGLIATHSFDTQVPGLRDIVAQNEERIRNGAIAYNALKEMRKDPSGMASEAQLDLFNQYKDDLGYGMLLEQHAVDPSNPTEAEIKTAARNSVPSVWLSYISFRLMISVFGVIAILVLAAAYFLWIRKDIEKQVWLLKPLSLLVIFALICIESGWMLAEFGRQPFVIQDVLPTYLAASSLSETDMWATVIFFIVVYAIFFVFFLMLMTKAILKGPELTPDDSVKQGGSAHAV